MARTDQEFINEGREALVARLSVELMHADDEGSVEQFLSGSFCCDR